MIAAASIDPPQTLLERLRARGANDGASSVAAGTAEARERERVELIVQGESALADGRVETALANFERAALMRHAADSEISLIRAYMQDGHYRRALAFAAHTAGAHTDVPGASALYAWLLFLGGQRAAAQRLVEGAAARVPDNPAVVFVHAALRGPAPTTKDIPLAPPVRLAPYGFKPDVPPKARWIGSGALIDGGHRVLIPTADLAVGTVVWIRNGLGEAGRARVERKLANAGAALARLERPLPVPEEMRVAPRDPFPGSVVYSVEYLAAREGAPGWPLLHAGFAGMPLANAKGRALGIDLPPGPRGGPVFDAQGRLAGIALPGRRGPDQLLLPSELVAQSAEHASAETPVAVPPRMGIDEIYERSLRVSVQVLVVR